MRYWQALAQRPAPLRLGVFVAVWLLPWLPLAALAAWLLPTRPSAETVASAGGAFVLFVGLLRVWGRRVQRVRQPLRYYGLTTTPAAGRDALQGFGVGAAAIAGLLATEVGLGWALLQPPALALPRLLGEGLLSALGVGLAEELVFRGWLLQELQRDYAAGTALWASAGIYASLHYVQPLPQLLQSLPALPGLIVLGAALAWARRARGGELGLAIGLHAGLVWGHYAIDVGELVRYPVELPTWATAFDGHPAASATGFLLLGGIALRLRRAARRRQPR
ncbi:MAG: CPBP family intramembrane metalloprotease [Cyanobacteria bacterium QS_8_64_29]|nr:MAG: CPBP family intramembrane metalloprotease [Cyanobacteria bacterium QS_8_64_29]